MIQGGDRSNSTTKADSACEGNDDPGGDTNHECNKHDFVYNPSGDLPRHNMTISTVHNDMPVSCHKPVQAKRLDFNAALNLQPLVHPSLPSPTRRHSQMKDANAAHSQTFKTIATTAATSKQSRTGLTGDSQILKPPGRCKERTHAGLGMGSALSSHHPTFAQPLN